VALTEIWPPGCARAEASSALAPAEAADDADAEEGDAEEPAEPAAQTEASPTAKSSASARQKPEPQPESPEKSTGSAASAQPVPSESGKLLQRDYEEPSWRGFDDLDAKASGKSAPKGPEKSAWPGFPWPGSKNLTKSDGKDGEQPGPAGADKPAWPGFNWPGARGFGKPDAKDAEKPDAKDGVENTGSKVAETPAESPADPSKSRKLRFQFRFQPWKDVLDWFARQADLSLVVSETVPTGTFNYSDDREYTPAEAIDLLNSVLLTKGFMLVRRGRMLQLFNTEDGIPDNAVSDVPLDTLDSKGEFEIVSVLFDLDKLKPEEAEAEVRKLLGPQGKVVTLGKSRQLRVIETAGRLRAIRSVLARIPEASGASQVEVITLKSARPEDVLPILRQLLEIPEEKPAAADGSIRISAESGTGRLLVSGKSEKVARVKEILKSIDVAAPGATAAGPLANTQQLEVYTITGSDPSAALTVIQTLLTGQTDVRLALDPKTNALIALARPAQHATIKATLSQLQREGQRLEVIRLARVDPQTAAEAINKLFGSTDPKALTAAPQVTVDATSRQLFVRGTDSQITQIRGLLEKMGEGPTAAGGASSEKIRTIPLAGRAARSALERAQEIWSSTHPNKIRLVTPSASIPESRPSAADEPWDEPQESPRRLPSVEPPAETTVPPISPPPTPPAPPPPPVLPPAENPSLPKSTVAKPRLLLGGATVILAADERARAPAPDASRPSAEATPRLPAAEGTKRPAEIIVIPGPNGLIIASEDTAALDEFEQLLNTLSGGAAAGTQQFTVFYLKHAKASAIAETLDQILAGGSASPAPAPAGAAPAGAAPSSLSLGALSMLGSRRLAATGPLKITPENRLNALLVQANAADLDTIEELLKVLDQKESPEDVAVAPKPRMIPVVHTQATEVADVVRQVYADRMVEGARGGQQQMMPGQPPWMGMQGFPGQGQGRGRRNSDDQPRMSIGVDQRTNSLVVAAIDPLFEEVKQLVEQLDVSSADQNQTVKVVTLHKASPDTIQQALATLGGSSVQFNRTSGANALGQSQFGGSQFGQYRRGGGRGRLGQGGMQPGFGQSGFGGQPGGFFPQPGFGAQPGFGQPGGMQPGGMPQPSFSTGGQPFGQPFGTSGGRGGRSRGGGGGRFGGDD
jgi:type II secretory pathway component GspD/PulD (secretin)